MALLQSVPRLKIADRQAMSNRKRLLVVDDSSTILHAICALLEDHVLLEVVGRAQSGPAALALVPSLMPDVVLLDADMPGMSGLTTAILLQQSFPSIQIALMAMQITPQFLGTCVSCGVSGVIYKPRFQRGLTSLLSQDQISGVTKSHNKRDSTGLLIPLEAGSPDTAG